MARVINEVHLLEKSSVIGRLLFRELKTFLLQLISGTRPRPESVPAPDGPQPAGPHLATEPDGRR